MGGDRENRGRQGFWRGGREGGRGVMWEAGGRREWRLAYMTEIAFGGRQGGGRGRGDVKKVKLPLWLRCCVCIMKG